MAKKIKDLTFLDMNLPSGNKICFDLIDNYYKVADAFSALFEFLPTSDEIKELMLFCNSRVIDRDIYKEIDENTEENNLDITKQVKGLELLSISNKAFIPFKGIINDGEIKYENDRAIILTRDNGDEDSEEYSGLTFYKTCVEFNDPKLYSTTYCQLILVKRND